MKIELIQGYNHEDYIWKTKTIRKIKNNRKNSSLLAIFAITGIDAFLDISGVGATGWVGGSIALLMLIFFTFNAGIKKK